MRLLVLLLLAPSLAFAQGLTTKAPGQSGQKRTNYALQSSSMSSGSAAVSPWTKNGTPTIATPVAGWMEVTSSVNNQYVYQDVTIPSSTSYVFSVYMVRGSGTGTAQIIMSCPGQTPTAYSCGRSDGGTCTAAVVVGAYRGAKITDLGTTPVRVWLAMTCNNAVTTPQVGLVAGEYNASTGVARFSGAQMEVALDKPSKLCVTTTAAKTCNN